MMDERMTDGGEKARRCSRMALAGLVLYGLGMNIIAAVVVFVLSVLHGGKQLLLAVTGQQE